MAQTFAYLLPKNITTLPHKIEVPELSCPSIEDINGHIASKDGWTIVENSHDLITGFRKKENHGFAKLLGKKNKGSDKIIYKFICVKLTELKIYKAYKIILLEAEVS